MGKRSNNSINVNTIWTSFDCGEVEAETKEEAIKQIKYDLEKANQILNSCDTTIGFTIEMDLSQIEITQIP